MPSDNHTADPQEHTIQSLFEINGSSVPSSSSSSSRLFNSQPTGHKFVDILKVDIEGAEYTAFESFIKAYKDKDEPLPFGQLLIELHVWGDYNNFEKFLGWWEMLEEAGLRPFWTEVSGSPKYLSLPFLPFPCLWFLFSLSWI